MIWKFKPTPRNLLSTQNELVPRCNCISSVCIRELLSLDKSWRGQPFFKMWWFCSLPFFLVSFRHVQELMSFQESASKMQNENINVKESLQWIARKLWMDFLNRRSHKFDFIGSLTAPYRKQSLTEKLENFRREWKSFKHACRGGLIYNTVRVSILRFM